MPVVAKIVEENTDRKQYPVIDIIKYICALLVVAIHISPFGSYCEQNEAIKFINYGIQNYLARIAVPFYFAAAGFFLFQKIDIYSSDERSLEVYIQKLLRLIGVWTVFLFVGGTGHLWYMGGLFVSVCFLAFLLYKKISLRRMVMIAVLLYLIGLLGDPYYGLLRPLRENLIISYALKTYEILFGTTRNGLFMGFPFLLLGGVIEKKKFTTKPLRAFIGFLLSMILLLGEAITIKLFELPKDVNMYIFLVPVIFFLLIFATNVQVTPRSIYKRMRYAGIIVYFSHLFIYQWIHWGWKVLERMFGIQAENSLLNYFLTILIATALGIIIDQLAKKKKYSFLKFLYS